MEMVCPSVRIFERVIGGFWWNFVQKVSGELIVFCSGPVKTPLYMKIGASLLILLEIFHWSKKLLHNSFLYFLKFWIFSSICMKIISGVWIVMHILSDQLCWARTVSAVNKNLCQWGYIKSQRMSLEDMFTTN